MIGAAFGRAWSRVVAFAAAREDATSLALCRIVVCTTVALHLAHALAVGAVTFAWTSVAEGGLGVHPGLLLDLFGGATARNVVVATVVCGLAALCGALGLFTRASLVATWVLWRDLTESTVDARSAYDVLIGNILFLLVLSGCGAALSVDAARRRRGASSEPGPVLVARWPRLLLVLQIGMLYFGSALMKASSGWVPGGDASALWFILHQPLWARFGDLPSWLYPVTQVATTSVWCFEALGLVFILAVLVREAAPDSRLRRSLVGRALERVRFRELYLAFGVAMHLGIEVTMEVGAFTGATLSLYFCAVRPAEWRALLHFTAGCSRRSRR